MLGGRGSIRISPGGLLTSPWWAFEPLLAGFWVDVLLFDILYNQIASDV